MKLFENVIITNIRPPVTVFSPKGRVENMKNRKFYGLCFCTEGQITYEHRGKKFISNSGNAIILPKGASYTLHRETDGLFPLINFDALNLDIDTFKVINLNNPSPFLDDFNTLCDLSLTEDKGLRIFSTFYGILDRLGTQQEKNPLEKITHYIETNLSDTRMTNLTLAQKMGISEVYLRKLFLSNLGQTPKQYILDLRIKTAKSLLTNSSKSVTQISEECGFSSVYHFCRIFKSKTNMTPLEYSGKYKVFTI